jgi:hypothetical protein
MPAPQNGPKATAADPCPARILLPGVREVERVSCSPRASRAERDPFVRKLETGRGPRWRVHASTRGTCRDLEKGLFQLDGWQPVICDRLSRRPRLGRSFGSLPYERCLHDLAVTLVAPFAR